MLIAPSRSRAARNGRLSLPSKNGAFVAVWSRDNPDTGEAEFALEPEDFEAIRQGYGCASCLADFNGVWLKKCPVCGEDRAQSELVVSQWWTSRSAV